jgi:hypothetical protein
LPKTKKGKDKVVKKQKNAGQVNGIKPQNKLVDFVQNNELFGNDDEEPAKQIELECGLDIGRKQVRKSSTFLSKLRVKQS